MPRVIDAFAQFFDDVGDPLVDGWLRFTESGTNNTDKDTFNDPNEITANTNPLQLDAAGRCPNVFGTGVYRVTSYTNDTVLLAPAVQVQQFDPVGDTGSAGTGGSWNYLTIYSQGDIVRGSDGNFYASLINNNQNNDPVLDPTSWEQVEFVSTWNVNKIYALNDFVKHTNGIFYISLQASNVAKDPDDEPTWWRALMLRTWVTGDTYGVNEVVIYTDGSLWRSLVAANTGNNPTTDDRTNWAPTAIDNTITFSGGDTLLSYTICELTDSGTYTLPPADSVPSGGWVLCELPDKFSGYIPTVEADGTDTITDINGVDPDSEVLFDALQSTIVRLTSDGISDWRI